MTDRRVPPKYNVAVVEAVILQVAAELDPEHFSTGALLLKVVSDADDAREIETGVQAIRKGIGKPIGSLTQLGHIRLGKRTEGRSPLIKDFVPLAKLEDLVFGAWDPIPDDAYASALNAGVLEEKHLAPLKDFLTQIKPMPAVFENKYVTRINGTNVKKGKTKRDLAEQLQAAQREANENQTQVQMRLPFERSEDDQKPKFYAMPQPAQPPKDLDYGPPQFHRRQAQNDA